MIFHRCEYEQLAALRLFASNGFTTHLLPGHYCPLVTVTSSANWSREPQGEEGALWLRASLADEDGNLFRYMDMIPFEACLPKVDSIFRSAKFGTMQGSGAKLLPAGALTEHISRIAPEDGQVFVVPPDHDASYLQVGEVDEGLKVRLSTYDRSKLRRCQPIEGAAIEYVIPTDRILWQGEPVDADPHFRRGATATIVHTGRADQLGIPSDPSPIRVIRCDGGE